MGNPIHVQPVDARRNESAPTPGGWLQREALVALLIFLCALLVRLIYLLQAAEVPFSSHPIVDGARYWNWAERIAAGNWRGAGVFFQAPLYPYVLAVMRTLFGANLSAVYVLQATLSSLGGALLYSAGRRLFSPVVGLAAGLMAAFYGPAIFYDGVLQKESIAVFLMSALIWLVVASMVRVRPGVSVTMGLALGLLALLRENTLLLAPLLFVWLWVQARGTPGFRRWIGPACQVIGLAIVLLPVGLRNLVVGGEFALTTSQLGINIYLGNNPNADGSYIPLRPGRGSPEFEQVDSTLLAEQAVGRPLSPREVSHYWLGESWRFIRSEPGTWVQLMTRKVLLFWGAYEVPDAEDLYFYQHWSSILRGLVGIWNFGVLLPLAAAGVCLTWSRRRELWVLYAMVLVIAVSVIAFIVFGRYRLPVVPLLILFAGAGVVAVTRASAERQWRSLLVAGVAALGTGLLANVTVFNPQQRLAMSFYNWAYVLTGAGRMEEAVEVNREALRLDPKMAEAHYNLGTLLASGRQFAEAIVEFRAAIDLREAYPEAWNNLGAALAMTGDRRGAAAALMRALIQDPGHPGARENLERILSTAMEPDEQDLRARIETFLRLPLQ